MVPPGGHQARAGRCAVRRRLLQQDHRPLRGVADRPAARQGPRAHLAHRVEGDRRDGARAEVPPRRLHGRDGQGADRRPVPPEPDGALSRRAPAPSPLRGRGGRGAERRAPRRVRQTPGPGGVGVRVARVHRGVGQDARRREELRQAHPEHEQAQHPVQAGVPHRAHFAGAGEPAEVGRGRAQAAAGRFQVARLDPPDTGRGGGGDRPPARRLRAAGHRGAEEVRARRQPPAAGREDRPAELPPRRRRVAAVQGRRRAEKGFRSDLRGDRARGAERDSRRVPVDATSEEEVARGTAGRFGRAHRPAR